MASSLVYLYRPERGQKEGQIWSCQHPARDRTSLSVLTRPREACLSGVQFTLSPGPRCTAPRRRWWTHTAVPSSSSQSTIHPLAMTSGRLKVALSCSRVHGPWSFGSRAARSMACSVWDLELRGMGQVRQRGLDREGGEAGSVR